MFVSSDEERKNKSYVAILRQVVGCRRLKRTTRRDMIPRGCNVRYKARLAGRFRRARFNVAGFSLLSRVSRSRKNGSHTRAHARTRTHTHTRQTRVHKAGTTDSDVVYPLAKRAWPRLPSERSTRVRSGEKTTFSFQSHVRGEALYLRSVPRSDAQGTTSASRNECKRNAVSYGHAKKFVFFYF